MQVLECSQFFSKINVTVICCVTRGREEGRDREREGEQWRPDRVDRVGKV